MWGQVFGVIPVLLVYRIIPTRVGTRVLQNLLSLQRKDHPHACGDKITAIILECVQRGSSPRVWGQEILKNLGYATARIIPTRVGTSKADIKNI